MNQMPTDDESWQPPQHTETLEGQFYFRAREEGADLAFSVPEIADEPTVVVHEIMDDSVAVTALGIAVAEDDSTLPEVVDVPLVVEAAEPDDDLGVRVSLLDQPTEPGLAEFPRGSEPCDA